MKDLTKVIIGFLAGLTVGSVAQLFLDRKHLDEVVSKANELLEVNDELRKDNMGLQCDLENCKVTNWQIACYCQNLKKTLDQFNE